MCKHQLLNMLGLVALENVIIGKLLRKSLFSTHGVSCRVPVYYVYTASMLSSRGVSCLFQVSK